jgi:hypothetical protein
VLFKKNHMLLAAIGGDIYGPIEAYRKERQLTASESGHYWRRGRGRGEKQALAQIEAGGSVHVTHLRTDLILLLSPDV